MLVAIVAFGFMGSSNATYIIQHCVKSDSYDIADYDGNDNGQVIVYSDYTC